MIAALVFGIGLALAAGAFGPGGGATPLPPTPRPGGGPPRPHLTVIQVIPIREPATSLTWGAGVLWAVLGEDRVGLLNPRTLQLRTTRHIPSMCSNSQIAYGADAAWVTTGGCLVPGRVVQVNPGSLATRRSGPAPGYAEGVAIWRGRPWITVPAGGPAVIAVDPVSARLHPQRLSIQGHIQSNNDTPRFISLLATPGRLWGVNAEPLNGITSIQPHGRNTLSGKGLLSNLPSVAVPLVLGDHHVWGAFGRRIVALASGNAADSAPPAVRAPDAVLGMTFTKGQLWFATSTALYRLRPGLGAAVRYLRLPFRIDSLVAGDGYLWAAATGVGAIARIGPLPGPVRAPAVGVIAG